MTNTNRESGNSVAAVAKALHTLRAFVDGQERWGVRELASSLGLPPSTTHRLLSTLKREDFLQQSGEEPEYTIGFEFTRLAAAVLQRNELHEVAAPVMREISGITGESVWLALYDASGQRIAYIAESEAIHASRYVAPLGREEGVVDNACGIAILASLSDEQRQHAMASARARMSADKLLALDAARHAGYAILRSTEVESAMIVAAAIKDSSGRCLGSLGIVVPLHRFGDGQGKIYGDRMQDACRRISARLGARFLGGSRSGSWGDAIGLINQTVKQHLPTLPITPVLGGGTRNLDALGTGMGAYGLTTSSSLYDAYHGR
ncbi:MAG TPA: helix-turn-helix domain-containing protein, partial [Burkholderiaceae bacterium]|nr:helix-turn-helix domain-containing protein [Burkholderiaceae bacterium]